MLLCLHFCEIKQVFVELQLLVQMVLKCADIGHLAADPKTHKRWALQLEEEFFRQVTSLAKLP